MTSPSVHHVLHLSPWSTSQLRYSPAWRFLLNHRSLSNPCVYTLHPPVSYVGVIESLVESGGYILAALVMATFAHYAIVELR